MFVPCFAIFRQLQCDPNSRPPELGRDCISDPMGEPSANDKPNLGCPGPILEIDFSSDTDVQRQPPRCRDSPLNRPRPPDSPSALSHLLPRLTSCHGMTGQLPSLETGLSPRGKLFVQRKDKACRSTPPPASIRAAVPSAAGVSITRS